MILQLDSVSLKRNGKWILKDINWRVEKTKLGAVRIKRSRKNGFAEYVMLLLLPHFRRDAGARPPIRQNRAR